MFRRLLSMFWRFPIWSLACPYLLSLRILIFLGSCPSRSFTLSLWSRRLISFPPLRHNVFSQPCFLSSMVFFELPWNFVPPCQVSSHLFDPASLFLALNEGACRWGSTPTVSNKKSLPPAFLNSLFFLFPQGQMVYLPLSHPPPSSPSCPFTPPFFRNVCNIARTDEIPFRLSFFLINSASVTPISYPEGTYSIPRTLFRPSWCPSPIIRPPALAVPSFLNQLSSDGLSSSHLTFSPPVSAHSFEDLLKDNRLFHHGKIFLRQPTLLGDVFSLFFLLPCYSASQKWDCLMNSEQPTKLSFMR